MRTMYFFLAALLLGIAAVVTAPYYAINPGVLSRGHEELKNDCLKCHSLAAGAVTEKCLECHKREGIGLKPVKAVADYKENKRANLLHRNITEIECVTCHLEHTGEAKNFAIKKFSHQIIGTSTREKCSACHDYQKPADDLHSLVKDECSKCHNTESWKGAKFDHASLGANKDNCTKCHEKVKPNDDLHASLAKGEQCAACHTTSAWKPSTFDHTKYFVFDRNHPETCSNCHTSGTGYKQYTCYNCHEHSEAKIARKHQKEGIADFTNCVKCHRSGNEHDIKGKGEGSGKNEGGREGKRENKGGEREHEGGED